MSSMDEFYNQIYNLAYITRYGIVPRVKNESVAEHSFFVSSIVIKLHDDYEFDLGKAVVMAVTHDWTESWLDDSVKIIKDKFPLIKEAVSISEREVAAHFFSDEICNLWFETHELTSTESIVVKYADTLQVIQYATNEIKLGNTGYMNKVLSEAKVCAKIYEEYLNDYRRKET